MTFASSQAQSIRGIGKDRFTITDVMRIALDSTPFSINPLPDKEFQQSVVQAMKHLFFFSTRHIFSRPGYCINRLRSAIRYSSYGRGAYRQCGFRGKDSRARLVPGGSSVTAAWSYVEDVDVDSHVDRTASIHPISGMCVRVECMASLHCSQRPSSTILICFVRFHSIRFL